MKDNWLKDINDKMSGFETDAPEGLWHDIEKRLDTIPGPGIGSNRRYTVFALWLKRTAGVAALLALIVASYMLFPRKDYNAAVPIAVINNYAPVVTVEKPSELQVMPAAYVKVSTKNTVENLFVAAENSDIIEPEQVMPIDGDKDILDGHIAENADTMPTVRQPKTVMAGDAGHIKPYMASTVHSHSHNDKLSVGIYTSGGFNSTSAVSGHGSSVAGVLGSDNAAWEDNPMLGILLFNKGQYIESEISHRFPVRGGVSFSYRINNRLSWESGITYANLTSDLKYGSDSHYLSGQQTLHYIGVPLNVKYDIVSWKNFTVYASGGVLAEKCVSGKLKKEYFIDNLAKETDTQSHVVKPLQWSVNASAGVQFDIVPSVGVYAEPGISYYFDNGSDIRTIYKDEPLNFNLNVGMRFNFGS